MALVFQACFYTRFLDDPGDDRGTCWEFTEDRLLSWNDPSRLGLSPAEIFAPYGLNSPMSGAWAEFPSELEPEFSFAFEPDVYALSEEAFSPAWVNSADICRTEWRLAAPTNAVLVPAETTLPPLAGLGTITTRIQGGQPSCSVGFAPEVEDTEGGTHWYDFAERHIEGIRPITLRVFFYSDCSEPRGTMRLEFELPPEYGGGLHTYDFGE